MAVSLEETTDHEAIQAFAVPAQLRGEYVFIVGFA